MVYRDLLLHGRDDVHFDVAIVTSNLPDNLQTEYTVQTGAESVTLRCPNEPGTLLNCYYGEWRKDGSRLVNVPAPRVRDCAPGIIENANPLRYRLDKGDFSLTIISPQASNDDGEYSCQLRFLDPATVGRTHSYPLRMLNLTVIGELYRTVINIIQCCFVCIKITTTPTTHNIVCTTPISHQGHLYTT